MLTWLRRLMKDTRRPIRHGNVRPKVEELENRLVPTLRIWDGGALFNDNWQDPQNWAGNERPSTGDDLRFPGGIGALDRTTNNDFPSGTRFNSIQFTGDDFRLSGNRIKLDAGGIQSPSEAGSNIIEFDIEILNGPVSTKVTPINVEGSTVLLGGAISGGGDRAQLFKQGTGTLVLAGNLPNTYVAPTLVEGTLILAKTAGVTSIPDDFDMTIRNDAIVLQDTSEQLGNGLRVSMFPGSEYLMGSGSNETIERLDMEGSTVGTGAGTLTVAGVNAFGQIVTRAATDSSTISGHLNLPNGGEFNIADGLALNDLIISASITTPNLRKRGLGRLVLEGNSPDLLGVQIFNGNLQVDGSLPNRPVLVFADTVLTGDGEVGEIRALGGIVSAGSPGVNAVGRLTASELDMFTASTLHVDINLFSNDQIHTTGAILLDEPTLEVTANVLTSPGDSFKIVDGDTRPADGFFRDVQGNLLEENDTFLVGARVFRIIYTGGADRNDIVIQHLNTDPQFQNRSVTSPIFEGQVATLTGTIIEVDPTDKFFLDVNWGDGSGTQTYVFPAGSNGKTIQVTHRYLDDAHYNIHAVWHDKHGGQNSADLPIWVMNVAPELTDLRVELDRNHRVTLTGRIVDPGRDSFTLVVCWGDGETSTFQFGRGTTRFEVHHRYDDAGRYKVRLNLTDDDGGKDVETLALHLASRGRDNDPWWIALCEFLGRDGDT